MHDIETRLQSIENTNRLLLKVASDKNATIEAARELRRLIISAETDFHIPPNILHAVAVLGVELGKYDQSKADLINPPARSSAMHADLSIAGKSYRVDVIETHQGLYEWSIASGSANPDVWDGPLIPRAFGNPDEALRDGIEYLLDGLESMGSDGHERA